MYAVWRQMRLRCTDETHKQFKDYGARGITVCQEWADSFHAFYSDMSPRPLDGLLDRIDNDKGYYRSNCRWTDRFTQNGNRRNCIYVVVSGERVNLREACRRTGMNYKCARKRVSLGWEPQRALEMPSKRKAA